MIASHRSCVLIVVVLAVSAIPGCCVPFWFELEIECPASMNVGQESTLVTRNVVDCIRWRQQSEENAGGVFVKDEWEAAEFRTGDGTRTNQIVFRAERAGIITITAEQFFGGALGAPCPFPRSTVQCTFPIVDE